MTQENNIKKRLEALSQEKSKLLALRLGISLQQKQQKNDKAILAAFVTTKDEVDEGILRNHLQQRLPQYMIPTTITVLDAIPRTPNGKVDRDALLQIRGEQTHIKTVQQNSEATDEIEQQLLELWRELLEIEIISIDDNFFELGGYSLLAIRMLGRIKEEFDKDLPASIILESPTIAQLAASLRENSVNLFKQTIFTLQEKGNKPPIFCFQVHKFGVITYRYLAEYLGAERPVYGLSLPQELEVKPTNVEDLAQIFVEALMAEHEPPYYLAGMSIAGLIAYEVARQLKANGIDNVHVVLFDTYGPGYPKMIALDKALQQRVLANIRTFLNSETNKIAFLDDMIWRNLYRGRFLFQKLINRFLHRLGLQQDDSVNNLEQEEYVPEQPNREYMGKQIYGEMIELLELEEQYFAEPKPYSGDILLYRSSLQPLRAAYQKNLNWDSLIEGKIIVRNVRGNHSGIMRYPFVKSLAERLNYDLLQLEKTSS